MSKRIKGHNKITAKPKTNNLVCRSCKMMMNKKSDSKTTANNSHLDDKMISGAPEDSVNKTIVRIQIK